MASAASDAEWPSVGNRTRRRVNSTRRTSASREVIRGKKVERRTASTAKNEVFDVAYGVMCEAGVKMCENVKLDDHGW